MARSTPSRCLQYHDGGLVDLGGHPGLHFGHAPRRSPVAARVLAVVALTVWCTAICCSRLAVSLSAGKNDSMASSETVTSAGVPNVAMVVNRDRFALGVTEPQWNHHGSLWTARPGQPFVGGAVRLDLLEEFS